jgi:hypothetical protein
VTQDESRVSVGGLLALDQVLENLGHVLTNFGTSTGWLKMKHKSKWISWDLTPFSGIFRFRVYVMGMECRPIGFYPCLGLFEKYK